MPFSGLDFDKVNFDSCGENQYKTIQLLFPTGLIHRAANGKISCWFRDIITLLKYKMFYRFSLVMPYLTGQNVIVENKEEETSTALLIFYLVKRWKG